VASTATVARLSPPPRHAVHDFLQRVRQIGFLETSQKAVERSVVGDRNQSQHSPQLAVFGKTDFGFAKGPVFVTHQARHGQQLGLGELVFAEGCAIARHRGPSYIQSHLREAHQTDFGHGFAAVSPELPAA